MSTLVLRPRARRNRLLRNPIEQVSLALIPKEVLAAAAAFRRVGPKVRTNLIGGAVVDMVSGREPKDWDIEVFGLDPERLLQVAKTLGPASEVGKAFGIVKVTLPSGLDLDLSVPRTDNRVGVGYKGVSVTLEPNMTNTEAARRRDFTINTLAIDLATGKLIDPFGGMADLKAGVLRATDPTLFVQDPLRGLRAMQLLARKAKIVHPDTVKLIQSIRGEFKDLPPARVLEEWRKLLLKADRPSVGLQFLQDSRWIENFPELAVLKGVPQHPEWHPEGDVWEHTKLTTDAAAQIRPYLREDQREPYMFAAMLHDVGKALPGITVTPEDVAAGRHPADRLYTAYGHDVAGAAPARAFMERIGAPNKVTDLVETLVEVHMQPHCLSSGGAERAAYTRLARKVRAVGGDLPLLSRVSQADAAGSRPRGERGFKADGSPDWEHIPTRELSAWQQKFDAEHTFLTPVVQGRDLIHLGYKPSKTFTEMTAKALELQDKGLSKEDILAEISRLYPRQNPRR